MNLAKRIDICVESLIRNDYVRSSDILGASENDIAALIRRSNLSDLPEDYKLFLTKYGNSRDLASYVPIDLTEYAGEAFEDSLNEIGLGSEIPEKYLVFSGNFDYASELLIESRDGEFEMIQYVLGDDFCVYPIISFIDHLERKTRSTIYKDYA